MSAPAPAIVLGLSPTGLHIVRAIAATGAEVVGVAEGLQAGRASRALAGIIDDTGDDAALLDNLLAQAAAWRSREMPRAVLIPSSDRHVEFIAAHSARLAEHFAFQPSYSDGLALKIMAKDSFAELCRDAGIATPQTVEATRESLSKAPPTLPFPWMIKPAEIHRIKGEMSGQKGWTVRDRAELARVVGLIPDHAGTLLVQEIVPGPESEIALTCCYVDVDGNFRQMFTARKLRQFPPGFGSASLVQSCPDDEAEHLTRKLLSHIGYRGIAAAEFKRDPASGILKIIEVNVRPSLWFSLSQEAGRPVVEEAYRAMAGLPPLTQAPQKNGVRWRYGLKDMYSAAFYKAKSDFILPAPALDAVGPARRIVSPVFSASDIGPSLAEARNFLQKATSRAFRRGSKDAA